MPTYEITAPDGRTYRVEGPAGATDAQVRAEVLRQHPQAGGGRASPRRASGLVREMGRQLGLTARYIPEGLSEVAGIVANPLNALLDKGLETLGSKFRFGSDVGGATSRALDQAGLPRPRTGTERVVGDMSRALVGMAPMLKAGQVAARSAKPLARSLGALAEAPLTQTGYAAAGAGSAGLAREANVGPVGQLAAGIGVPILGGAIISRANSLRLPFTKAGRDQIAGSVLRNQSNDPDAAIHAMKNAKEIVPGSAPTMAGASQDMGLAAMEKVLRSRQPAAFGARMSEQNLARQLAMDEVAGTPKDISDAIARRSRVTDAMRDAAFASGRQADVSPVDQAARRILQNPANRREMAVQAVDDFRRRIGQETDPQALYAIRQDIGDAMSGKLAGDKGNYKFARKQLMELRNELDDVIESAAPGFKAYLSRYRGMSKPINQMEILQEIQSRSGLSVPDISTGRDVLSQASFGRRVDAALADPEVARALAPKQVERLRTIMADLDRGAAINSSSLRAPGSDTFQNLSMANVVGAQLGGGVPTGLAFAERPFRWIYKYSDQQIEQLLTEAALDPKMAAQLMLRATPSNARVVGRRLEIWARQRALGTTVGSQLAE